MKRQRSEEDCWCLDRQFGKACGCRAEDRRVCLDYATVSESLVPRIGRDLMHVVLDYAELDEARRRRKRDEAGRQWVLFWTPMVEMMLHAYFLKGVDSFQDFMDGTYMDAEEKHEPLPLQDTMLADFHANVLPALRDCSTLTWQERHDEHFYSDEDVDATDMHWPYNPRHVMPRLSKWQRVHGCTLRFK
jgi:hypothetical protein